MCRHGCVDFAEDVMRVMRCDAVCRASPTQRHASFCLVDFCAVPLWSRFVPSTLCCRSPMPSDRGACSLHAITRQTMGDDDSRALPLISTCQQMLKHKATPITYVRYPWYHDGWILADVDIGVHSYPDSNGVKGFTRQYTQRN